MQKSLFISLLLFVLTTLLIFQDQYKLQIKCQNDKIKAAIQNCNLKKKQNQSEKMKNISLERHVFTLNDKNEFVYDLYQFSADLKPILLILPGFEYLSKDIIEGYINIFVRNSLISTAFVIYERGLHKPLNRESNLPDFYTNVQDISAIMNRARGQFYVLSMGESSIKALNLFYSVNEQVRVIAYLTIHPLLDIVDWETRTTSNDLKNILKSFLEFNVEFCVKCFSDGDSTLIQTFNDDSTRQNFDTLFLKHFNVASPEDLYQQAIQSYEISDLKDIHWFIFSNSRSPAINEIAGICNNALIVSRKSISHLGLFNILEQYILTIKTL